MKRELIKEKLIDLIKSKLPVGDVEITEDYDFVKDMGLADHGFDNFKIIIDNEFGDTDINFQARGLFKRKTFREVINHLAGRLITPDEYIPKLKPGDRVEVFGDVDEPSLGIGTLLEYYDCYSVYPEMHQIEQWDLILDDSEDGKSALHYVRVSDKVEE